MNLVYTIIFIIFNICFINSCNLSCLHGGVPDKTCSNCINCAGAWQGKFCDQWNFSVPYDTILEEMLYLIGEKTKNPHITSSPILPLPTSLGLGVDITTGTLKLPILQINYNPSDIWTNPNKKQFLKGYGTSISLLNSSSQLGTIMFEGMYDYIQYLYGFSNSKNIKIFGNFEHQDDLVNLYKQYFTGDTYISVVNQIFPGYDAKLTNPLSFQLDPIALRAIHCLPPDFSTQTNQAIYRTFVKYWGTHFVIESKNGGILTLQSFVNKRILNNNNGPFTKDGVEKMSAQEFESIAWGDGSVSNINQQYINNRKVGTLECLGGNAVELCTKRSEWKTTVLDNGFPFQVIIQNITDLLPEPLKSNIAKSIQEFETEQYDKWTRDFPTCPDCLWGTCKQGQKVCTCYNDHITGQSCDICKNGWMNDQCNIPICNPPCRDGFGVCIAPNTCKCFYGYYPPSCTPICGDNIVAWPEQCDYHGFESCCSPICTLIAGTICRQAMGDCDESETCNGFSDRCPPDKPASSTKICHMGIGECDSNVRCNGISKNCPSINGASEVRGKMCRQSMGPCDDGAFCDGFSTTCPHNHYNSGKPCFGIDRKIHYCNGLGPNCPYF